MMWRYTIVMHIYFSGIGGVGIGPLAEIAHDAGYIVSGSDQRESLMTAQLKDRGIDIRIGQDGSQIADVHSKKPIDWIVYTSALPDDHAELAFARDNHIRASKRDELLAEIIREKDLKLLAVSGTHGKTNTTAMLVWTLKQLNIPASYSVGSSLSFGQSGVFDSTSEYFVYECDEFDRNMLHFFPHLSLITSIDHDHVDVYPTEADYAQAFVQFIEQSDYSLLWEKDLRKLHADPQADLESYDEYMDLSYFALPGDHTRHNAFLVERAIMHLLPDTDHAAIVGALNTFPGAGRRVERLAENLYSDYGHHPAEIAATLQMVRELSDHVVLVYQPHQNVRQHEVRDEYTTVTELADTVYWLPTYLTREHPDQAVLTPQQLTEKLTNRDAVKYANTNDELWQNIQRERDNGKLVLVMGAGPIDEWVRQRLADTK